MRPNKKYLSSPAETDPFANMILRPNKSPLLKPVVVSSRDVLKVSRSAGSIRDRIKLPPLATTRNSQKVFHMPIDRNTVNTPNFRINSKRFSYNEKEKKQHKVPEFEITFGDIDEQIGGLSDIMKKYRS